MKSIEIEIRRIREVNEHAVYFHEVPDLSIARHWFPNAREGQRWKVTIDYSLAVIGKVIATELIEEEPCQES